MEYIILNAESFGDLTMKVNEWTKLGFLPQGGVAVSLNSGGTLYSQKQFYQAMIKTK